MVVDNLMLWMVCIGRWWLTVVLRFFGGRRSMWMV